MHVTTNKRQIPLRKVSIQSGEFSCDSTRRAYKRFNAKRQRQVGNLASAYVADLLQAEEIEKKEAAEREEARIKGVQEAFYRQLAKLREEFYDRTAALQEATNRQLPPGECVFAHDREYDSWW